MLAGPSDINTIRQKLQIITLSRLWRRNWYRHNSHVGGLRDLRDRMSIHLCHQQHHQKYCHQHTTQ